MAYHIGTLFGGAFLVLFFFLIGKSLLNKHRENGSTGYKVGGYFCLGLSVLFLLRFFERLLFGA